MRALFFCIRSAYAVRGILRAGTSAVVARPPLFRYICGIMEEFIDIRRIPRGQKIETTVAGISGGTIFLDLNAKTEGILDAAEFEPPSFQCFYEAENWTEDSLLSYILDPQGYAAKEATDYMEGNQEEKLFDFLCNDAELAEYQALVEDTDNPVHIVKKIMAAMNTTSAKTVNVTIYKDGEKFSFKTEAQELRRDCKDYYSTWNIVAADRRKFEQRFGRHAEYYPQEIIRITYARAVLYEAGK